MAPEPREAPSEPPTHKFRPGGHVGHKFSADELIDFKITGKTDQLGRTTARYFEHEGRRFGLEDEKYQALKRVSEGVQKTKAFRDLVSTKWVEDKILDWMKEKYAGAVVPTLAEFLAQRCEEEVREHEIWFPVSNLSVESDLSFGNVVFKTISKEMLDDLEQAAQRAKEQGVKAGRGEEYAAQVDYSTLRCG